MGGRPSEWPLTVCIPLCTICLCFGFPLSLPGGLLLADALSTAMFLAHSEVVLGMQAAAPVPVPPPVPPPVPVPSRQPPPKKSPGSSAGPGPGPRQREASRASIDSGFSERTLSRNQQQEQQGEGEEGGEKEGDALPAEEDDEFAFHDEDIDERAEDIAEEVTITLTITLTLPRSGVTDGWCHPTLPCRCPPRSTSTACCNTWCARSVGACPSP